MPLRANRPEEVKFIVVDFKNEAMIRKCFDGSLFGVWSITHEKLSEPKLQWTPKDEEGYETITLSPGDMMVLRGNSDGGLVAVFRRELPEDRTLASIYEWDDSQSEEGLYL